MERAAPALWQAYEALKREQPRLRARDAARQLHISEAELVAADPASTPLRDDDWPGLLSELASLGRVMALTRNEACVHEKTGVYDQLSFDGKVGLALNPDIDLRIFLFHWRHAFAVRQGGEHGEQCSLQFFDRHGDAIQKVFLTADSDAVAFSALVARWQAPPANVMPEARPARAPETPDADIDRAAFQARWRQLNDVHQFHGFLRDFGVSRQQGFRLAPPGQAWRVALNATEHMLRSAATRQLPIMVFVGNAGMIQIHTGPVQRIDTMGPWLNVLDPGFNLHLREDLIDAAWVTRKPGDTGVVTSLELFDRDGQSVVTFFGARKPGQPELPAWQALMDSLPREPHTA